MVLADPYPALTDGTVVLRRWTTADLGCVRAASQEGRVNEYTSVPERFTEEDGKAFIRRQQGRTRAGRGWSLAVGDARSKEVFGCAVLGFLSMHGLAGTVTSCTGAKRVTVLGNVTSGWEPLALSPPDRGSPTRLRVESSAG